MSNKLFDTFDLSGITLKNRVVMAPMTRSRCPGNIPGKLVARYYGQRAEAGLIITEGTSPSPNGLGYPRIPGLYSAEQMEGWRGVAEAVHEGGSHVFVQLMHVGRVGHPLNLPRGARLLAPSAEAAPGEMFTDSKGPKPHPTPVAMTGQEVTEAIEEYAKSAELAVEAGLDGVELHGANGYLIDQFLNTASNLRDDRWGGSVAGRIRFAVEVARTVADRIGAGKVGVRVSPYGVFNGMAPDPEHDELYAALADALNELGLAYIHVVDHSSMGAPAVKDEVKAEIRCRFNGPYILSGGYELARAEADLVEGKGDLVAFGRPFIANPNLVSKLRDGAELLDPKPEFFYSMGEQGYTDFSR
jgi:N-ethylmaleimide reductase